MLCVVCGEPIEKEGSKERLSFCSDICKEFWFSDDEERESIVQSVLEDEMNRAWEGE